MTRYFTEVTDELLPAIRSGERMPATLRYIRDVETRDGTTIVELEDDVAPARIDGWLVTPTISIDTTTGRTWVSNWDVRGGYVPSSPTAPDPKD